jgi:5-methylcytosine-specific restriction endonuclease McrA
MDEALEKATRKRARNACEYCHLPVHFSASPFEIEHVVPKQHGGRTILSNLAFSCLRCIVARDQTCQVLIERSTAQG